MFVVEVLRFSALHFPEHSRLVFSIKNITEKKQNASMSGHDRSKANTTIDQSFYTFTRSKISFRVWESMANNYNDNVWPGQTFLEKNNELYWNKGSHLQISLNSCRTNMIIIQFNSIREETHSSCGTRRFEKYHVFST